jgi:tetratricopeptide (TPR) repeat protein
MTNQDKNNDDLTPSNQGKINKYSSDLIKKGLDLARSLQDNLLAEKNTEDIFDPDYYKSKADELFSQGKYQEALIYYEKSSHSRDCNLHFFSRGHELIRLYEYEMALQYFDKSIEIDMIYSNYYSSSNSHHWMGKAEVLTKMGCYQDALNCYDRIIGFAPWHHNAWLDKAKIFRDELHSFEDALYCYNKLLEINNLNQGYWNQIIDLLLELGRFEEVDYTYSQNIENLQKSEELYDNWKDEDHALNSLLENKALQFSLWVARADEIVLCLGKHEEAINYCDNALNIFKELQELYKCLISLGIEEINFDEWFQYLLQDWSGNGIDDIWQSDTRGMWLTKYVSPEHRRVEYSLRRDNIIPNIWCFKGNMFQLMENYHQALTCYEKALKIQPEQSKI